MLSITCPGCSRVGKLKVTPPAGALVRCPGCGQRFEVPKASDVIDLVPDLATTPAPAPTHRGIATTRGRIALGSAALVGVVLGALVIGRMRTIGPSHRGVSPEASKPVLKSDLAIKRGSAAELNHSDLGIEALKRGDYAAAERHYRDAVAKDEATEPRNHASEAFSRQGLGETLHRLGRHGEAVDQLLSANECQERANKVSGSPDANRGYQAMRASQIFRLLAMAELGDGQTDEGLEDFALAVKLNDEFEGPPGNGGWWLELARLYQGYKRYEKADKALAQAYERFKTQGSFLGMADCQDQGAALAGESRPDTEKNRSAIMLMKARATAARQLYREDTEKAARAPGR